MNYVIERSMREFFEDKQVQIALSTNNMEEVYNLALTYLYQYGISDVTYILINAGVDPLSGMIEIPKYFLYGRGDVEEFNIPPEILTIKAYAFSECRNLKYFDIPKTVTDVEADAFSFCINLTHVNIRAEITEIKNDCFSNCVRLVAVNLPVALQRIWRAAFDNCTSLRDIYFEGTMMDWLRVKIGSDNKAIYKCIVHCKDADLKWGGEWLPENLRVSF